MIGQRRLGRTGLYVPELGLGTAPLGNLYRRIADLEARSTLDAAMDAGLRLVDTAPYYGFGLAEKRVGEALHGRDGVIVSTKVGRLLAPRQGAACDERHGFVSSEPFDPVFDYSHDGVLRSHEASLDRLGRAHVDILYVHDIGRLTHGDAHPRMLAQLLEGGGLRALERLRGEGAIRAFGVGVNETEIALELLERADMDVILLAGRYTLLEQGALDALLPRCLRSGVSVIVGGPYNSGILAGGASAPLRYDYALAPPEVVDRVRRIEDVCRRHETPMGAAALQFVLAHPAVASVIPGLAAAAEVADTIERYAAAIPDALWDELRAEGLIRRDAPTPMNAQLEQDRA